MHITRALPRSAMMAKDDYERRRAYAAPCARYAQRAAFCHAYHVAICHVYVIATRHATFVVAAPLMLIDARYVTLCFVLLLPTICCAGKVAMPRVMLLTALLMPRYAYRFSRSIRGRADAMHMPLRHMPRYAFCCAA